MLPMQYAKNTNAVAVTLLVYPATLLAGICNASTRDATKEPICVTVSVVLSYIASVIHTK